MELRISPVAAQDMLRTKAHIADGLDSPIAALNFIRKMILIINRLPKNPELGEPLSKIIKIPLEYFYVVCGGYIILYMADEKHLTIHRVLYGKRDYIKALFGDIEENELPSG